MRTKYQNHNSKITNETIDNYLQSKHALKEAKRDLRNKKEALIIKLVEWKDTNLLTIDETKLQTFLFRNFNNEN